MGLSNELFCEAGSFSRCCNPHRFLQSGILRLYFPTLGPWVVGLSRSPVVPPSLSACKCGTPNPPASILLGVLFTWLPISGPPTGLGECFFFNSLVVELPYSLIFCQFWLFFVFKFFVVLFWLCEEAQCVYLRLHLGWKSVHLFCSLDSASEQNLMKDKILQFATEWIGLDSIMLSEISQRNTASLRSSHSSPCPASLSAILLQHPWEPSVW